MKVRDTKLMKDLLKDPAARKQLQRALADSSKTVVVNGTEYELVPVGQ
jgi:hypothetical protein